MKPNGRHFASNQCRRQARRSFPALVRSFLCLLALSLVWLPSARAQLPPNGADSAAPSRGYIALFGTEECDDCAAVKKQWPEAFALAEDPLLIFLPIEHAPNYALLNRLEDILQPGKKAETFPVFLVGDKLIAELDAFYELADELPTLSKTVPPLPILAELAQTAATAVGKQVIELRVRVEQPASEAEGAAKLPAVGTAAVAELLYFFQKGCAKCSRQEKELALLHEQLPALRLASYDVATLDGQAILRRAKLHFAIDAKDKNLAPMVCWSEGFISGRLASAAELQEALAQSSAEPFWTAPISDAERRSEQQQQGRLLSSFTIGMVILAGLIDGFNPCAFATSVFLIGYLLYLKRRPREIAIVGFSFCAGVFLAYVLFGVGLSFLLDIISELIWIKKAIYGFFALAALLLAAGHLRDAIRVRKSGKASDMSLGLSTDTHRKIHDRIKSLTAQRSWLMLPAAILLGVLVSSMELACTGQIYLPTLAAINAQGINLRAFLLLILYNICFILPLAAITAMAIAGIGSKPLVAWGKKHVGSTKIAMALLFIAIAIVMAALALA
jgi:cytochrome c biogenesis protein CcdA